MRTVITNRRILETFLDEALLTKDEEFIVRTRAAGWSRQQQAFELGVSVGTLDRMIHGIKCKYDSVSKYSSNLPERT
jgi:hypothetical protein